MAEILTGSSAFLVERDYYKNQLAKSEAKLKSVLSLLEDRQLLCAILEEGHADWVQRDDERTIHECLAGALLSYIKERING
jgi:hypothetical protein